MILAYALFAAAQTTFVDLHDPADDDRPRAATFHPVRPELLVAHESGGINTIHLNTGAVTPAVSSSTGYSTLEFLPGGAQYVAADFAAHRLDLFGFPNHSALASSTYSTQDELQVILARGAARAVVLGETHASLIDLAAGSEVAYVPLPAYAGPYFEGALRAALAADDRTLVVIAGDATSRELHAIDLLTGATTAVQALPFSFTTRIVGQSGDRSRVITAWTRTAPAATFYLEHDARSLQVLETTTLWSHIAPAALQVDLTAAACHVVLHGRLARLPLDGAAHSLGGPSVPSQALDVGSRVAASLDLSQVFVFAPSRGGLLYDSALSPVAQVPIFEAPGGSFVELTDPSGRYLGFVAGERLVIVDVASGVPFLGALDVSTGVGPERDGPFMITALGRGPNSGADRALVSFQQSDRVASLDLRAGTVVGDLPVPRGPIALAERADGLVLVGCEDGTVLVVDPRGPAGPTERARFSLSGPVVEIVAAPSGGDAWLRVEGTPGDSLVRVDTASANPTPSARLALASRTVFRSNFDSRRVSSIAIDFAAQRAVAVSRDPVMAVSTTAELLDLVQQTVIDRVADVPLAMALAPDGARVHFADPEFVSGVQTFSVSAAGLQPLWARTDRDDPAVGAPFAVGGGLALDASGDVLFANLTVTPALGATSAGFVALDARTGVTLASLGDRVCTGFCVANDTLVLGLGDRFQVTRFAGSAFAPVEETPAPVPFVTAPQIDAARGRVVAVVDASAIGFASGGLVTLDLFAGRSTALCAGGAPNATGVQAALDFEGSPFAGGMLAAVVSGLEPGGMFGVLVIGDASAPPTPLPFGNGALCVGGAVGRLAAPPQLADPAGVQRHLIATAPLATSAQVRFVQPGETFTFQLWHRDRTPSGAGSANTSAARALTFR
ncbi:MAG: hypothetical protein R3F49_24920 [Planctomycetota bacterium]